MFKHTYLCVVYSCFSWLSLTLYTDLPGLIISVRDRLNYFAEAATSIYLACGAKSCYDQLHRCLDQRDQVNVLSSYFVTALLTYIETSKRLLIYHSGTGKTVFIGCFKLTTIFLFSFSCLLVAPAFYKAPDQSNWLAAGSVIGGAIPMLFVLYTTSPFVTYIHLRVPAFARHSKDMLGKYPETLPGYTELTLTTMRPSGRPRITSVRLSELRRVDRRLGVVNLARHTPEDNDGAGKRTWLGNGAAQFYVGSSMNKVKQNGVLQNVLRSIKKEHA